MDTLTLATLLYLSAYLTILVKAIRYKGPEHDGHSQGYVLLRTCTLALGAVGIFLYALQAPLPRGVQMVWRPIWVACLVGAFVDSVRSYEHLQRKPDPRVPAHVSEVGSALSVATWMVLELPSLWMNFRVAFPG